MQKMIVVDMDPGIDDLYALTVMMYAHNLGIISILAVVCSFGNASVENTCNNILRILEVLNITTIPVYKGPRRGIVVDRYSDSYFGKDGFGDIPNVSQPNLMKLRKENSAEVLYNLAQAIPRKVSLVTLGPTTFAAEALLQYDILLKDIWILGGNSENVKKVEFNFKNDPESAYSLFHKARIPIYMLTFQTCTNVSVNTGWRKNILGTIQNPLMDLFNQAEEKNFLSKPDTAPWVMCDAIMAAALTHPEIIKSVHSYNATINLNWNDPFKGLVVYNSKTCKGNVKVIDSIDTKAFKGILYNSVKNIIVS